MPRKNMSVFLENLKLKIQSELFGPKALPLVLSMTTLAILFVLFRMKGVELDYKISETNRKIDQALVENKDLKAVKANLLSTENIRFLAKKFDLHQPKQEQIIVIQ